MENDTKYPLLIIGVALLTLVAFNFEDLFTGGVTLKTAPTTFPQERLNFVRTIDIVSSVDIGSTIGIRFVSSDNNDLIMINKEKIKIYKMKNGRYDYKKQLTYPRCNDGRASACFEAEKSVLIPVSWEKGQYRVQIEREGKIGNKVITEIIGRASFTVN